MIESAFLNVNIENIITDNYFKISKKNYNQTLTSSLKLSGMLEIPYIFKSGSGYNILTCHNRINILRQTGIQSLDCFVLDEPDADIFMNHAVLKAYRNELGPAGKLKTLFLLSSFFKINESTRKDYCTKILKLPADIIENDNFLNTVMNFPESTISYLDERDLNFKIIKDISLLPVEWINVIDYWIKNIQVRVNIFRMLIDNLFDIYRRGDAISAIESIIFSDDKSLYDAVFKIRYPGFSKIKAESDSLINELSGGGVAIDFPEYFDRGFFTIKLDINKKTDCGVQLKKISGINVEKLKKLLSLLSA